MFKSFFNGPKEIPALSKIGNITAPELKDRLNAGEPIFLLDVRSSMEYQFDGHIPGSRLLPLNALHGRMSELPIDQTIVCICRSGNRSMSACEELVKAGFENVVNLSGGMFAWQVTKNPVQ